MLVSRMMAEVGGIEKVSGRRMATPLAPPSPGSTPMMVPSVMPMTARNKLWGWSATWKPRSRFSKPMALVTEPGFQGPLGHRYQEPGLEDQEGDEGEARAHDEHCRPRVAADPAHVAPHVERRRQVEPEELREQHEGGRGPQYLQNRGDPGARDERSAVAPPESLGDDAQTRGDHDHTQPEGEEAAIGSVRTPPDAQTQRIPQRQEAHRDEQRRSAEIRYAHGPDANSSAAPLVQVVLERRRLVDLLEEALVPIRGLLGHVGGTEDAPEHQVLDVGAQGLLDRRDVLPLRDRDARPVEHRERPDAAGLPVARALDGVVDRGVHVLADEVDAHLAATLEGHEGELHTLRLLQEDGDDLVLLGGPRTAHLHPVIAARSLLDGRDVLLGGLMRGLGVHPEDELVQSHARDRREVLPVERHAGVERRREEVRERDDDGVRVRLLALDVQKPLGAGPARLVDHDERARGELVLLGDAGDEPRHLVGAASGPRRDDELDRLGRLPGRDGGGGRRDNEDRADEQSREPSPVTCHVLSSPQSSRFGEIGGQEVEALLHKQVAAREVPRLETHKGQAPTTSLAVESQANGYFPGVSLRNGITPGISHLSHIWSTLAWKYSRSSSVKWAKRPCLSRYSRTGLRGRPSTMALVLP